MILVDILIEVLEKHGIDKSMISDDLAQAISSNMAEALEKEDMHTVWSTEARELFEPALVELKDLKSKATRVQRRVELGNLIFKIEELLIKH